MTAEEQGPAVVVLLSTYNGEKFLAEQLDSILAQTGVDVLVSARDDGSSDRSREILRQYQSRHPGRIFLPELPPGNLGPVASFAVLLEHALESAKDYPNSRRYFAFADQDDVWAGAKLAADMQQMLLAEGLSPGPVLVHSDLRVVNANLEPIAPSLAVYQGLQPRRQNFGRMLVANNVTGCTVLINAALAREALPIPATAVMHDWWLALAARITGRVVYIDRPLVDYRQHTGNTLGARPAGRPAGLMQRPSGSRDGELLAQVARQAESCRTRFAHQAGWYQGLLCRLASLLRIRIPLLQKIIYRVLRMV